MPHFASSSPNFTAPHAGFNREHVFDKAVALGVLLQQLKAESRFISP
jgi:hypothetical protein